MKETFVKLTEKLAIKLCLFKTYRHKFRELLRTLLIVTKPNKNNDLKECSLVTLVEKARTEWEEAKRFFNEAQDPDLIDHAIYAMEAAERRYMYLLKEARKEKVVHEDIYYVLNNNVS